jgi:hypothetical protein
MNKRVSFLVALVWFAVGCSEPVKQPTAAIPAKPPILVSISPASTVAGQAFNVQADGRSAIGVNFKDATGAAVIVFGSKPLDTAHGADFLSAIVPPELYANPGNVPVFIRDAGGESNKVDFVVKPAGK